jgi:hypothetical protein
MPKWQMARDFCQNGTQIIFMLVLDSADTKGILIASHDKKPNDHDTKKSSDWHLTSDVLDGKICLLGLDNTTNLEICYEEVFFYR